MRIVHIAAGAGGMYCGACARDLALVRALIARGHDVELLPLYTPPRDDGGGAVPMAPVRFGGINVFLQQGSGIFRRLPLLDRLVDSPRVLRWVSRFAIETRAENLGPMTVSVLAGREGRQRRELAKLLDALAAGPRPDVLSLTNSLLSAIAPEVKERLGVPVFCSLQGEDHFVEAMPEPYRSQALRLVRANARAIDGFFSPGEAYAERMAAFLDVPRQRIRVVRAGIDAATYIPKAPRAREPFTLGYLSVIIPGKGLDLLVDAAARLVNGEGRDLRLLVAGKPLNARYWADIQARVARAGLAERFEYRGELPPAEKPAFLHRCSAFALPSRIPESRAMAALEALAAGVPIVVPETGVFPELLALIGGGLSFAAGDAAGLAAAVGRLMDDPELADRMGRDGFAGIARHFDAGAAADAVLEEYARAAVGGRPESGVVA